MEQIEDKEELALQVGSKYLSIQKCDEGYDYTFYDANYHGLDGGVIENKDVQISIVVAEVIAAEGLRSTKLVKEVDYDMLQEYVAYTAAYEMKAIEKKKVDGDSRFH
ncbi:LPD16 domain-containing protein [Pseudobutyrivibrio sp. MD2005]|uniref:LPD16 domain-containing protein n=1 Tax=Pseudobutyrivibrio sp. MD2005 TaxID=1410616 RepID=UPI0012DCB785|nr:LPD16 domain-containing protein [Pseudobutyrivibrio sp. MD2005]